MFILSKTNYQDFENNLESFKTLKEAQDVMQSYYTEDKKTVEGIVGDVDDAGDAGDDVTLFISDYCIFNHK